MRNWKSTKKDREDKLSTPSAPSATAKKIPVLDSEPSDVKSKTSTTACSYSSVCAGTAMNLTDNQKGKLPAFIGDNFNSVDEVCIIAVACLLRKCVILST